MTVKGEQVKEVIQSRAVKRHIRAQERQRNGIGEIIAAALGNRGQIPVALDEFQDRDVVGVAMGDVPRLGVGETRR